MMALGFVTYARLLCALLVRNVFVSKSFLSGVSDNSGEHGVCGVRNVCEARMCTVSSLHV